MNSVAIPFVILILSLPGMASAQSEAGKIYSWKDSSGVTRYGDASSAPKNAKEQKVKVSQPGRSMSSEQASVSSPTDNRPSVSSKTDDPMAKQCQTVKNNIDLLSNASNQAVDYENGNSNGSLKVLTDEERSSRLELAKAAEKVYCRADGF